MNMVTLVTVIQLIYWWPWWQSYWVLLSAFKSMTGFPSNNWFSIYSTFFYQMAWLVFQQIAGFPSFWHSSVKWLDFQLVQTGRLEIQSFDGKTSKWWKTSHLTENQSSTWKQMEALSMKCDAKVELIQNQKIVVVPNINTIQILHFFFQAYDVYF